MNMGELGFRDLYDPLSAGKYGMKYILVMQDAFSKLIKLYPLRRATGAEVLRGIKSFIMKSR